MSIYMSARAELAESFSVLLDSQIAFFFIVAHFLP